MQSNLSYINNELLFKGRPIKSFAKDYPTPFYLYDTHQVAKNYNAYKEALETEKLDALICYALKANNNPGVLSCLLKLGSGVDVVSGGELKHALNLGFSPDKIVFSGVGKTEEEIRFALKAKVYSLNAESIEELELIARLAQDLGIKARVGLRFNPEVEAQTHKYISTGGSTHKFGMFREDIEHCLKSASIWEHLKLVGLSIHIGSQLEEFTATRIAIEQMAALATKHSLRLEFLDIGGGLGVNYQGDLKPGLEISTYVKAVAQTIRPALNGARLLLEPGRSLVADAGILVCKVIRRKKSRGKDFLIVDGGMNDFIRPTLYDAYHEILPSRNSEEKFKTQVVGPVCETSDFFGTDRMLPQLNEGDYVVISHAGAYGSTMSSSYNMRPPAKEYLAD